MTGRRFQGPRPPRHSSTFPDQATAERVIFGLVEREEITVSVWLASDQKRLHLDGVADDVTGLSMERAGLATPVRGLRVVLEQSCRMPDGFVVLTAYPTPEARAPGDHGPPLETPALAHLIGAYFHQDWWEDHGGEAWVIAAFLRESRRLAQNLPGEIEATLAAFPTDPELEAHLDGLGCEFTPRPDEGGYRAWLADVGGRVAARATG